MFRVETPFQVSLFHISKGLYWALLKGRMRSISTKFPMDHYSQHVTKPPLRTSQTALRRPIRFLLRRPNRRQDRRPLRRSLPENLITCIVTLIPHVTHHVQSSRDSWLSRFTKCLNSCLSHPLSLFGRLIPTHIILALHSKGVTPSTCCTVSLVTLWL